jgi:Flp pilus assembly protein TadG
MRIHFGRSGSVTMMTGLLAIPLVAMIGLAVDLSRIWLVRSRLQTSLDAAVLVVARDLATGGTSADGINLFWANFGRTSGPSTIGFLGATATTPVVYNPAPGGPTGSVELTSTATITPAILGVLNIGAVTVSGASTAQSAAFGLELSMVLDNTGSMAGWPITSVISSANDLLGILYGSSDTQPNLWVSVVPFAAAVNMGNTHTSWLVAGTINQSPYAPSQWMGCVMARNAQTGATNGDDSNDAPPSSGHYFEPFLYPSTYHMYPSSAGIQYTTGTGKNKQTLTYWYPGDNDWQTSTWTATGNEPDASNNSVGPNLDCPSLAILPETASKSAVEAVINQMVPVYRGGTFINLGLQAGWFTISPNWQGLWGSPTLPLAYGTPYMKKAIVLMTDGNNEWYDWDCGVPGQTPPTSGCPWSTTPPTGVPQWTANGDADFTAYGRLLTNTAGVSPTNITTTLNTWMSDMCTTIKANGITIYTILFNHDSISAATQTLFQNCASSPSYYFLSPTDADLQSAFQQIGSDLSTLRLSQ